MKKLILILPLLISSFFVNGQYSEPININRNGIGTQIPIDIDNDGDLDIVARNNSTIFLYKNDGSNNFREKEIKLLEDPLISGNNSESLFASDINQDGFEDLFIGYGNGGYGCYLNSGNNSLIHSWDTINTNLDVISFGLADFDLDGLKDLVVSKYGLDFTNTTLWHKNLGNGIFDTAQIASSNNLGTVYVYTADVDYDGIQDIYMGSNRGNGTSEYAWYKNNGTGVFGPKTVIGSGNRIIQVSFSDIDGDNIKDIISSSFGSTDRVCWFKNDGNGNFSSIIVLPAPSVTNYNPYNSVPTDFDNDGDIDIITMRSNCLFHENDGFGNFSMPVELNLTPGTNLIKSGAKNGSIDPDMNAYVLDFNGDGQDEILCDNRLLVKKSGINLEQVIIANNSSIANNTKSIDLDNDGDLDILTEYNNDASDPEPYWNLGWYENNQDLNFSAIQPIKILGLGKIYPGTGLNAIDMNNDSLLDIIASIDPFSGPNDIAWLENSGNTTFDNIFQNTGVNNMAKQIEFFDIDNDLDKDIVFRSFSGIYKSNNLGNGSFASPVLITNLSTPHFSLVDIDGDSNFDILAALPGLILLAGTKMMVLAIFLQFK